MVTITTITQEYWRARVRGLRQPRITEVDMVEHREEGTDMRVLVPTLSGLQVGVTAGPESKVAKAARVAKHDHVSEARVADIAGGGKPCSTAGTTLGLRHSAAAQLKQ